MSCCVAQLMPASTPEVEPEPVLHESTCDVGTWETGDMVRCEELWGEWVEGAWEDVWRARTCTVTMVACLATP